MSRETEQKIKLLVLWDILCERTDENHALNTDEIIALLADAVQASKLSATQKQTLTEKLMATMGNFQATELTAAAHYGISPKRNNKYIFYTIDTLKQSIVHNRKVSFKYYSLDYQKKKVYHNGGERYIVNPLAIFWNKDNYYLIRCDDKHEGTANYRIGRITEAKEETDERNIKDEYADFDVEKYRVQVFSMFGGDEQEVELQFESSMLDDVFDKFGEEIEVEKTGEDTYKIKVTIQVSKTFFAWVAGTQGKARILSPQAICNKFNEFVAKIKEEY